MKKSNVIFILVVLVVVSIWIGNNYFNSRVRTNIYDNSKKYNELLVTAVNNLKENGTENKELSDNIGDFYDKYKTKKTSKKENELLSEILDEVTYYDRMMYDKKKGNTDAFNKDLSMFEESTRKLNIYFKK